MKNRGGVYACRRVTSSQGGCVGGRGEVRPPRPRAPRTTQKFTLIFFLSRQNARRPPLPRNPRSDRPPPGGERASQAHAARGGTGQGAAGPEITKRAGRERANALSARVALPRVSPLLALSPFFPLSPSLPPHTGPLRRGRHRRPEERGKPGRPHHPGRPRRRLPPPRPRGRGGLLHADRLPHRPGRPVLRGRPHPGRGPAQGPGRHGRRPAGRGCGHRHHGRPGQGGRRLLHLRGVRAQPHRAAGGGRQGPIRCGGLRLRHLLWRRFAARLRQGHRHHRQPGQLGRRQGL